MIRRGLPRAVDQLHAAKLFERETSPVLVRSRVCEPALACSAVLIAKNSQLALAIPAEPMWTKLPNAPCVKGLHRLFGRHRSPDQAIDVVHRLDVCSNDSHRMRLKIKDL